MAWLHYSFLLHHSCPAVPHMAWLLLPGDVAERERPDGQRQPHQGLVGAAPLLELGLCAAHAWPACVQPRCGQGHGGVMTILLDVAAMQGPVRWSSEGRS